jgi:hypothetical protein
VLGDKKIPKPNLSGTGPSSSAKAEADKLNDLFREQQALIIQKDTQSKAVSKARDAYIEAKNNLPQGDSEIETAKQAYIAEVKAFGDITDKIRDIANKA